jgi:hypothetical protein
MRFGFLGILASFLAVFAVGTGVANAGERMSLSITNAWYLESANEGDTHVGYVALDPGGDPIRLGGDLNPDGSFAIPSDGFVFSPLHPAFALLGVSYSYEPREEITGSYSAGSGNMTMSVPMAYVVRGKTMTEEGSRQIACQFGPFPVEFKTSGSAKGTPTFNGRPFANGNGQLLGGWTVPWSSLSASVQGIEGTSTADCVDEDPVEEEGNFAAKIWLRADIGFEHFPSVKMAFKTAKATVGAGKATSVRLRLQNVTNARQTVNVGLKSSNKNVRVKKTVKVSVPANSTFLTEVKVNANKKAKGKAKITATWDGQTSVSTVTVKPSR